MRINVKDQVEYIKKSHFLSKEFKIVLINLLLQDYVRKEIQGLFSEVNQDEE